MGFRASGFTALGVRLSEAAVASRESGDGAFRGMGFGFRALGFKVYRFRVGFPTIKSYGRALNPRTPNPKPLHPQNPSPAMPYSVAILLLSFPDYSHTIIYTKSLFILFIQNSIS